MTTQAQRNKKIIAQFFNELWFANNLAVIDQYIAKNAIISSPLLLSVGPGAKHSITEQWFTSFPKITNIWQELIVTNDHIIIRWRSRAVQQDIFRGVVPYTSNAIEYDGISCYKLHKGLIVEYQAHFNLQALHGNNKIYNDRERLLECLSIINGIKLTVREIESLSLWVAGITSKKAGKILKISNRTIESYRENIKAKLHVYSKEQLFDCLEGYDVLQQLFYFGRNCVRRLQKC